MRKGENRVEWGVIPEQNKGELGQGHPHKGGRESQHSRRLFVLWTVVQEGATGKTVGEKIYLMVQRGKSTATIRKKSRKSLVAW